ncbi:MAG: hypothetical protein JNK64_37805 [Myxococcales bacterium]|nr:hypothetical protein [Myxococcales bacterium]
MRALACVLLAACAAPAPPPPRLPAHAADAAVAATVDAPAVPPVVDAAPGLTAADVAADLATLRATLDALHPGLHRYVTPAELDAAFAATAAALGDRPRVADVYLALARLTARLACGHTFPNPHNQSDAVAAAVLDGPRLPFAFRWIDGAMVITRAFVDDARLAPGTRVRAIDGVADGDLLTRLLPLGRADGSNRAKRLASLEIHGGDRVEAFDIYLPLVAPTISPPYALKLVAPDGQVRQIEVAAMSAADRVAAAPDPAATDDAPLWALTWLDATTAYLRMPTWVAYRTRWDWQADLDRTMAAVARRKGARLIVDLRGNEGGSDVGDRILAHVITRPIAARGTERWVRYRAVPAALRPPLDTWDASFFDWGDDAIATADPAWFRLADEPGAATLAPARPRFRGKLVVLVDASNSSATFQFAWRVQTLGLGTLIAGRRRTTPSRRPSRRCSASASPPGSRRSATARSASSWRCGRRPRSTRWPPPSGSPR